MNKIKNTTWAATMLVALCLCAGANRLQAQSVYEPYTFTTLAGGGGPGRADGTGSAARFQSPSGVATDASGNVYVADAGPLGRFPSTRNVGGDRRHQLDGNRSLQWAACRGLFLTKL